MPEFNNAGMAKITGTEIQKMVRHWLNTPAGAYLGSSYGSNLKDLLQHPQADGMADSVISKMRADIPLLQSLAEGAINIYSVGTAPDRLDLMIEVAGQAIEVPGA